MQCEKLKAFPLRSVTKKEWPGLPLQFKIVLEVLVRAVRKQTETKGI